MIDPEMVERVACAAYCEYSGQDPKAEWSWWYGKEEGKPFDWRNEAERTSVGAEGFLRCARAAIAAMHEPTAEMIAAGRSGGEINIDWGFDAKEAWRAMIDAALHHGPV